MTVTIGAICEASHATQTGSIILCADTLVTHSYNGMPISSNQHGSKVFDLPLGFCGALSDDISRGVHVRSYLYQVMQGIDPLDARRIDLVQSALLSTAEYVLKWVRAEVIGRHKITLDEFLQNRKLANRREIKEEIKNELIPTQLIIGGFSLTGGPILLFTDCIQTQQETTPGFFCGGAGGWAARDWLNMRGQNSSLSIARTAYHVHEAKRFAAKICPVVGNGHHALLLRHNQPVVSVGGDRDVMAKWLAEYQPRDTGALDSAEAYADFAKAYDISDSTSSSGDHT